MIEQPRRSKVGLYIALVIIGVFVLLGIGCAVFVSNLMKRPEVRQMMSAISELSKVETVMPNLTESIKAYKDKNGDFPEKIGDISQFGATPETMSIVSTMTYKKPAKSDSDNTVILFRKMGFGDEGEMNIEVTKDLRAWQVTRNLLGHKKRGVNFRVGD